MSIDKPDNKYNILEIIAVITFWTLVLGGVIPMEWETPRFATWLVPLDF